MLMDDVKEVLISQEKITERCRELGEEISRDYEGSVPVIIGLLKGSVPFMAELMKNITIDCETEYMAVSSYSGTESMGDVKIVKDLDRSIVSRDVLVVEDIVDTGKTLEKVKGMTAALFIPSHAAATEDISALAQYNIDTVNDIAGRILELCAEPLCFEQLLKILFSEYSLTMNFEQYVLVGSTVRSYLSWLKDKGELAVLFDDGMLLWRRS